VNTFKSLANLAGILNSLAVITIIMNQNDSSKDGLASQKVSISDGNPLRYFTGLFLIFQFVFLLIKIKIN